MSNLIVIAFDNEHDAERVRDELGNMQKQELIKLDDAAVVIRKMDGKVKVKQATSLVGAGALGAENSSGQLRIWHLNGHELILENNTEWQMIPNNIMFIIIMLLLLCYIIIFAQFSLHARYCKQS